MTEAPRFAEMINKIAHELRSPLTSVKGFSSTLIKRWDRFTDEQKFQFVETINHDADRMGRIVSEVLDLARLETGRLELHCANVNLRAAAEQAAEHHRSLPGAERVEVDVDGALTAWADPERLSHIFGNIVENAIKFSDEGPVRIAAEPIDEDRVSIAITDAGVGIEPERIEGIFSGPAPAGQRAGPSGTGLGLYLTKRLIEKHGGTIEVASEASKGSTFTLVLRRKAPDDG